MDRVELSRKDSPPDRLRRRASQFLNALTICKHGPAHGKS